MQVEGMLYAGQLQKYAHLIKVNKNIYSYWNYN